jgi:predicted GNAT family N-acyltransferase
MSENLPIIVKRVTANDVYPLRHRVLRPNQTMADCIWAQDSEAHTAHFAAEINGQIIGIASIAISPREGDPPNTWRLRGMATVPELQGQGVGAQVLSACLVHAKSCGGTLMWCNARTKALTFYLRHGFETVGEEFEIKGIGPHYVMIHPL